MELVEDYDFKIKPNNATQTFGPGLKEINRGTPNVRLQDSKSEDIIKVNDQEEDPNTEHFEG